MHKLVCQTDNISSQILCYGIMSWQANLAVPGTFTHKHFFIVMKIVILNREGSNEA